MTPASFGAHPTVEEIDALLDAPGEVYDTVLYDQVSDHVAQCSHCSKVRDDLHQTRSILRSEAATLPPMPAGLAEKLAAALADQAAQSPLHSATITPLRGPEDRLSSSTSAALPQQRSLPQQRRSVWTKALTAAAALVVALGVGIPLVMNRDLPDGSTTAQSQPSAGPLASMATTHSGMNYDQSNLGGQVQKLLGSSMSAGGDSVEVQRYSPTETTNKSGTTTAGAFANAEQMSACLSVLGQKSVTPLAVDVATWQGKPAVVFVLPRPQGAGSTATAGSGDALGFHGTQVWVVSPECGKDGKDHLLHYQVVTP